MHIQPQDIRQELEREIKGKKRVVKEGKLPHHFQIEIMHDKTNDLCGLEVIANNLHMKSSKLNEVVATRVSNVHSSIREIVRNLAEID